MIGGILAAIANHAEYAPSPPRKIFIVWAASKLKLLELKFFKSLTWCLEALESGEY